jgi:hypothetical protein
MNILKGLGDLEEMGIGHLMGMDFFFWRGLMKMF